ncbi:YfhD family protein [Bacillus sp. AGMB 02131]|uniref:YfhD family protein n=1 Tax=Peribacillus faecalis TaxID=2772559 RepID=A0A927D1X3_9BACI|nr:YfhD family protein [Peribacillus faecalis]MBD3109529.1 YfhD family protein [Peribacillus faecalis]
MGKQNQNENYDEIVEQYKAFQTDGVDVDFEIGKADQDDLEALARSEAADERAKNRKQH